MSRILETIDVVTHLRSSLVDLSAYELDPVHYLGDDRQGGTRQSVEVKNAKQRERDQAKRDGKLPHFGTIEAHTRRAERSPAPYTICPLSIGAMELADKEAEYIYRLAVRAVKRGILDGVETRRALSHLWLKHGRTVALRPSNGIGVSPVFERLCLALDGCSGELGDVSTEVRGWDKVRALSTSVMSNPRWVAEREARLIAGHGVPASDSTMYRRKTELMARGLVPIRDTPEGRQWRADYLAEESRGARDARLRGLRRGAA